MIDLIRTFFFFIYLFNADSDLAVYTANISDLIQKLLNNPATVKLHTLLLQLSRLVLCGGSGEGSTQSEK